MLIRKKKMNKMKVPIKIRETAFDLHKICNSGQCFRMKRLTDAAYTIIAYGAYLEISQKGEEFVFSCTEEEYGKIWHTYFSLDDNYDSIRNLVKLDNNYMKEAVHYGWGIRILKQELWETIISFIISQQNNIPRIRNSIEQLCEKFGERKYNFRNEAYYTFPKPDKLADLDLRDLQNCGLGYRSKYVLKTAQVIAEDISFLQELSHLTYADAKEKLMTLYGVGIKVSECICLFALHHLNAFPIDTHIQRVLAENYPEGFPFSLYKGCEGILQQYAFYYDLRKSS